MKTRDVKRIVIALLIVLGTGLVGIAVRFRIGGNGEDPEGGESYVVKFEALPESDCEAIRSEIDLHTNTLFFVSEEGTGVMIPPHDYPKDSPLLIVCPMQRTVEGVIEPFEPNSVSFIAADPSRRGEHPGSYDLNGAKRLCIPVTREFVRSALQAERKYSVGASILQSGTIGPLSYRTTVTVPKDFENEKVYRIQLVLRDLLKEKTDAERRQAEAELLRRLSEEEKITVNFTTVPDPYLVILYDDGDRSKEESPIIHEGDTVVIKGPNKLGGELGVFPTKSRGKCWAYIKRLDKKSVTLPKDADIVVGEDELVELRVSVDKEDLAKVSKYKGITFYASSDSRLPLFWSGFQKLASQDPNAPKELPVRVLPGTYYVRVGKPREDETPIGTVTVEGTDPEPYSVKLPD